MKTEKSNENYLLDEEVSFIQHFLPGLDAGEYQLTISQQVLNNNLQPVNGDGDTLTSYFAVRGDRFYLSNPASLVSSVFPADNATGEFSTVLPNVVFTKTTFPWIRYPNATEPSHKPGDDVATWLFVLLLDDEDVQACTADNLTLKLKPIACTIGDLFPPAAVPASSLNQNYSYFNGATDTSGLEPGEQTSDPIQAIDIPLQLFWQIAPTSDDLKQIAHGRIVSLTAEAHETGGIPTGSFSTVFGNRLPNTEKKTYAYLVSLEELESFLPQAGGIPPAGNNYSATFSLRLAVLKHWTFFNTGESATFVHKLENLNNKGTGLTNLALPYTGSNKVVKDALSMGYTALNETLRTGEKTVSWYRGPLVPYSTGASTLNLPIPSSDSVLSFDPTTGMLDTSYAAAWNLGRMMALQSKSFSTGLYNWKKGLTQQIINNAEQNLIQNTLGSSLNQSIEAPPDKENSLFKKVALATSHNKK